MNILFVHQAFPGQFCHIIDSLGSSGNHQLYGLGIEECKKTLPKKFHYQRYQPQRSNAAGVHPMALETETKVIRADACAGAALQLKQQGIKPDLIMSHPGWGESLFLKDVWPQARLLTYQEFFYHPYGFDLNFDPELQSANDLGMVCKARMKNANVLLNLHMSDWCVTPTAFQRSSFPAEYRSRITAIHDGIDTAKAAPNPTLKGVTLPSGVKLKRGQPVITFVNRTIEPYRGCHTMIRAIPLIQQRIPNAQIVIVGAEKGASYGKRCPDGEWKDHFLKEIEGQYNSNQVHFTGSVPYELYLQLLQLSTVHIYLTYPFVMSWSLLEAMSSGCTVVGSRTAPVMEVLEDGVNGRLVDFFSPQELSDCVQELVEDRQQAEQLGRTARETILARYERNHCVQQQINLMELVGSGALSA
jgi:glycosyltransferase involved in cell wall biosynthesis